MLDAYDIEFLYKRIAVAVWGGFEEQEKVEKGVERDLGVDDHALVGELKAHIRRQFRDHRRREARWREPITTTPSTDLSTS
ncbi:hypothetical protein LO772_31730 [Yinghuangia sp. ASG 101]|uniref:hypothetical protein n=1 Tax=Yinghuangia sp. ASG 101 TaxID=2896848 RepID=UPI001E3CE469|nr:hypothetical protein [Yinghuangia sp. ASG 101]UGQ11318.1 hypothetical protein LO772_31730 [Yinghuangia sp. ASG 101]